MLAFIIRWAFVCFDNKQTPDQAWRRCRQYPRRIGPICSSGGTSQRILFRKLVLQPQRGTDDDMCRFNSATVPGDNVHVGVGSGGKVVAPAQYDAIPQSRHLKCHRSTIPRQCRSDQRTRLPATFNRRVGSPFLMAARPIRGRVTERSNRSKVKRRLTRRNHHHAKSRQPAVLSRQPLSIALLIDDLACKRQRCGLSWVILQYHLDRAASSTERHSRGALRKGVRRCGRRCQFEVLPH